MLKSNAVIVTAALAILVGALTAANPNRGEAAGSAPVHVVNTPLPVTGVISGNVTANIPGPVALVAGTTVNVGNTVSATVSGEVALAAGATVNVGNDVIVGNTAANPVLVRNVDEFGDLVRLNFILSMAAGEQGAAQVVYTVPTGKRLVVEHLSARLGAPTGQYLLEFILLGNIPSGSYWDLFVPQHTGTYAGTEFYTVNQNTKVVFTEDDVVRMSVFRSAGAGFASAAGFITGKLLPNP